MSGPVLPAGGVSASCEEQASALHLGLLAFINLFLSHGSQRLGLCIPKPWKETMNEQIRAPGAQGAGAAQGRPWHFRRLPGVLSFPWPTSHQSKES